MSHFIIRMIILIVFYAAFAALTDRAFRRPPPWWYPISVSALVGLLLSFLGAFS